MALTKPRAEQIEFIPEGGTSTNVQAKLGEFVSIKDFGAVGDGVTDDYVAIQSAIDYVASLTGAKHDGSSTINSWPIGDVRGIEMSATKYATSKKIILKNSVSLFANGGGLVALPGFAVGDYVIETEGTSYYAGQVKELHIDGNNLNVKGININNVLGTCWDTIAVSNCKNDGITYSGGADFVLNGFVVSGAYTPTSNGVAGLKIAAASDAVFINGVCRFTPIGIYIDGGGNNEFMNIHCWGGYADIKQYINFYIKASYRNSFVSCYGDSPTKQNYSLTNWTVVGGLPNGGVCWYFGAGPGTSGAQENKFTNCRPYVNWDAYTNTGLPANQLLYGYFEANCLQNEFNGLIDIGGAPAGKTLAFVSNPWGATTPTVRDNNVVFGSSFPTLPNLQVSRVGNVSDNLVPLTINNTDGSYAGSGGKVQFSVTGVEKGSVSIVQGAGGTSPILYQTAGAGSVKLTNTGQFLPVVDNAQNLGDATNRWSVVYAGSGTINTSDKREKTNIIELDVAEKRVANTLKRLVKRFQFKDAVAIKGETARLHVGVIAQEVVAAFDAEGLDPMRYAIVCYDEWDATLNDAGEQIKPAGNRYGVRYEEMLAFIISTL